MCTHLQRRGNCYYIRRSIPLDLITPYGRIEISRALGLLKSGQTGVNTNKYLTVFNVLLNYASYEWDAVFAPAGTLGGNDTLRNSQAQTMAFTVACGMTILKKWFENSFDMGFRYSRPLESIRKLY